MGKSIVMFYTWSGHTRKMAEIIAGLTGADLLEIEPVTPYSKSYNAVVNQAKNEIKTGYLPAIKPAEIDLSLYDVVYIGTPIWWGTMAPPLAACLSSRNFVGKTVMPFSTHGGGGKGHADRDMEKLCAGASIKPMYTAYEGGAAAEKEMAEWIQNNLK
ncbi:MAG: flavodoxin [Candidatus Heteroscillospira sp.]|jgi:flavodoxin